MGGADADVGPEQRLLEVVPGLLVDRRGRGSRRAGQRAPGLAEAVAEARPDHRLHDRGLVDDLLDLGVTVVSASGRTISSTTTTSAGVLEIVAGSARRPRGRGPR